MGIIGQGHREDKGTDGRVHRGRSCDSQVTPQQFKAFLYVRKGLPEGTRHCLRLYDGSETSHTTWGCHQDEYTSGLDRPIQPVRPGTQAPTTIVTSFDNEVETMFQNQIGPAGSTGSIGN